MFPVLEAATQSAGGRGAASGESDAATAAMITKYGAGALRLGAGDFAGYKHLIESARLYGGADNYAGAEDSYRKALDIEIRLFGADSLAVGETLAELALQVSNQSRFDEAAALFRRASPIIEASSSNTARARLASYEALDAANQRNFEDALKFARAASALRRAEIDSAKAAAVTNDADAGELTAPVTLEGELAHSLRIEAEMALRLGDNASAQASAEEALWIITEEPGLPIWWKPEMIALMGEVNAAQGRVVIAERDFGDAVALDKKLFGDTAPTARAELRLGRFYAEQQVYDASVAAFREAFAILDKDPVARAQITSDQIVPFLAAASALGAQAPAQRAALDADMFRAAQLVNSGVADQTIARVAARQAAGDAGLSDLVRQLEAAQHARDNARLELVAENAKPNDERNAGLADRYATDLKTASANADALQARVAKSYPDYAKLADPGPVTLADFQKQLGHGEAFVGFIVGARSSFALVVTPNALTATPLTATTQSLAADITDLRGAFVPKLGRLSDFSLKSSYTLYQELLAPAEAALAGTDHLIVAPGGDLDSLPLSLLVTSAPAGNNYANAAWLIRKMAVSQVPSPRAFVALRAERATHKPAPRPFFGVGNPGFTGTTGPKALGALAAACQQGGIADPALLRALPPLPETGGEVEAVGRTLGAQPGSILTGANATEGAVRNAKLEQYAVVYFATHGMLPGELHCQAEPGLALSPPAGAPASAASDGLLSASEIATLKLDADLVVLSACNTAASGGTKFGGGALEGLADSFFDAGARAVLASHWEVPSLATQKLMTGIFSRYAKDPSRDLAEALRQSQLALIAQPATAHPFNWAAFTLIGDSGASVRTARNGD
jgi:CHAT domain-containing protein